MKISRILLWIMILIGPISADIISPTPQSTLNYTQVLFEWEQIPGVELYNLQVYTNEADLLIDIETESLTYLSTSELHWSDLFYFVVRDAENTSNSTSEYYFNISDTIDLGELNVTLTNSYCPDGLTIFGNLIPAFSAAVDCNGNQVWHSGSMGSYIYYNSTKHGDLYGGKFYSERQPGIEFNVDLTLDYEEPDTTILGAQGSPIVNFIQHEILKTSNGYLSFTPSEQIFMTPFCSETPGCNIPLSWESNYDNPIAIYRGEGIVLRSFDGTQIWNWSAFDNISQYDYDPILNWNAYPMLGYYDWTHFNALDIEEDENGLTAIYLSSRSLSRMYKIDYPSGDILWSMGYDWYGNGNVTINLSSESGYYNGFTFQHGLQVLDNGNILTLDNGNISAYLPYFLFEEGYTGAMTRALEIDIDETNSTAEIVWSYTLPEDLFGELSGNVQKLDNGNYLITTVGDYGHSIEVNQLGEIVWDLQYKVGELNLGSIYRANRITSLFPTRYSIISNDLKSGQIAITSEDFSIDFTITNDGSETEEFSYNFYNTNSNAIGLSIYPLSRKDLEKNITYNYSSTNSVDLSDIGQAGTISIPANSNSIISIASTYIQGCTNSIACNYNSEANFDDGSCTYETDIVDCDGNILNITNDTISPEEFNIINAYPNPFNPTVTFEFETNYFTDINISVFDINGKITDNIFEGFIDAGFHKFEWNGSNLPSGIYFINIASKDRTKTKKITLLK